MYIGLSVNKNYASKFAGRRANENNIIIQQKGKEINSSGLKQ